MAETEKSTEFEIIKEFFVISVSTIIFIMVNRSIHRYSDYIGGYEEFIGPILLGLIFGYLIFWRYYKRQKWLFFVVSTLILLFFGSFFVYDLFIKPQPSVTILIDGSENMQENFDEALHRISLIAQSTSDDLDVGFAVFGAQLSMNSGCEDVLQLFNPVPKAESLAQILSMSEELRGIQPGGYSGSQQAIMKTIQQLSGRRGRQSLILIGTRLDDRCGGVNPFAIEQFAEQMRVDFELKIITLGEISEDDRIAYENIAKGNCLHLGDIVDPKESDIEIAVFVSQASQETQETERSREKGSGWSALWESVRAFVEPTPKSKNGFFYDSPVFTASPITQIFKPLKTTGIVKTTPVTTYMPSVPTLIELTPPYNAGTSIPNDTDSPTVKSPPYPAPSETLDDTKAPSTPEPTTPSLGTDPVATTPVNQTEFPTEEQTIEPDPTEEVTEESDPSDTEPTDEPEPTDEEQMEETEQPNSEETDEPEESMDEGTDEPYPSE